MSNEEIARVFAMYYGCDLFEDIGNTTCQMLGVDRIRVLCRTSDGEPYRNLRRVKLLLIPLSMISDEDAIEVAKLKNSKFFSAMDFKYEVYKNSFGDTVVSWGTFHFEKYLIETKGDISEYYNGAQVDFLREKGYMIPYKGKSIFELGIAIDKTQYQQHQIATP